MVLWMPFDYRRMFASWTGWARICVRRAWEVSNNNNFYGQSDALELGRLYMDSTVQEITANHIVVICNLTIKVDSYWESRQCEPHWNMQITTDQILYKSRGTLRKLDHYFFRSSNKIQTDKHEINRNTQTPSSSSILIQWIQIHKTSKNERVYELEQNFLLTHFACNPHNLIIESETV